MSNAPHWVSFGRVVRAHGVKGELRVVPDTPDVTFPPSTKQVRLSSPRLGERVYAVSRVRPVHRAVLLTLEEVDDREAAAALASAELSVAQSAVPEPEPGDIYVYELLGAGVEDEQGQLLGQVARVLDNAGQTLLEIDCAGELRLLPLVDEIVVDFRRSENVLVVRPVPGLWD